MAKGWVLRQSLKSGVALRVMGHVGRVSEALGVNLVLREGHLQSLSWVLWLEG